MESLGDGFCESLNRMAIEGFRMLSFFAIYVRSLMLYIALNMSSCDNLIVIMHVAESVLCGDELVKLFLA